MGSINFLPPLSAVTTLPPYGLSPSGTRSWNNHFFHDRPLFVVFYHSSRKVSNNTQAGVVRACRCKCCRGGLGRGMLSGVKKMQELGDYYSTQKCLLLPLSLLPLSFIPSSPFFFLSRINNFLIAHSLWPLNVSLVQFVLVEHPGMLAITVGKRCTTAEVVRGWRRWKIWPHDTICMCRNIRTKEGML